MKDYNIMESQSHRFSEVYFHFLFIKNQENRMNGSRNPIALVRSISTMFAVDLLLMKGQLQVAIPSL